MGIVHIDPQVPNAELRRLLYEGHLVVLTRLDPLAEFVSFAREQLHELFAPHDPIQVHHHFTPEELARKLGAWKPLFIHHPRSKQLLKAVVTSAGFDPYETMYDVPKPRTAYPSDHLTTGIAFAFPWHRDTWYAAPSCQINWWFPVFPVRPDNAMKFDSLSFARAVDNDSASFDAYEANRARLTTAKQVGKEIQPRPGAREHVAADELVILPAPGQIILFSGAQLHASIRNDSGLSRYSIDFRTMDSRDLMAGVGAPMADVHCTGTMLREFSRITSDEKLPEDFIREMAGAPPEDAILLFDEELARKSSKVL